MDILDLSVSSSNFGVQVSLICKIWFISGQNGEFECLTDYWKIIRKVDAPNRHTEPSDSAPIPQRVGRVCELAFCLSYFLFGLHHYFSVSIVVSLGCHDRCSCVWFPVLCVHLLYMRFKKKQKNTEDLIKVHIHNAENTISGVSAPQRKKHNQVKWWSQSNQMAESNQ